MIKYRNIIYKIIKIGNGCFIKMPTVYDFTVKDRQVKDVSLTEYKGKVLMIVNTAADCGFTPHYELLEEMYKELER